MKMMKKALGASLALLCAMSAQSADIAPAASAPLPQDGTLVVAGDSITFHAVSLPCGFHHQLTNAFAKVCPEKRLKVASLGFSGYQVGTWLGVESKTRDGKPYMTHVKPGWNVTEVLSNKVDVVAIFLGMNDILQPSVRDDDAALDKWAADLKSLAVALRARTHASGMILCTTTPLTADPGSPKNLVRERMSERLRKVAAEEGYAVAEFGDAVQGAIEDCRRASTSFQPVPDFVHPRKLGHLAMARELCRALGEAKCAEFIAADYAAELKNQNAQEKSPIAWRLRPLTKALSSDVCRYRIDWFWHDTPDLQAPGEGVAMQISLPEGWSVVDKKDRGREGFFVVRGRPERITNEVKLAADLPKGAFFETVSVHAPWLVSRPWDFPQAWHGQNWQSNAVPTKAAEDALAGPWSLVTPTYDYTGFNAPGSLDPWQAFFGGNLDSFWAVRRVVSEKARRVKAVFSHQTFSATLGLVVFVNGRQVFKESMNRRGKNKVETELNLVEGANEIRIRVDHANWQRQFSMDLKPLPGDSLDGLRYVLLPPKENVKIAVRGEPSAYDVSIPADAAPSQKYAAEELSAYVEKITGVKLPVVSGAASRQSVRIVLDPALGDGFRLKWEGRDLVVSGGARGVLYGVYELLEAYGGVGWFASWHEVVPKADSFSVPAGLDRSERPAFEMREPLWFDSFKGDFAARLRLNGNSQRIGVKHGGHSHRFGGGLGNCHTFNRLMPPDEFFDKHPEYFSMIKGKRVKDHSQLCLTNPDVLRIVTERVLAAIRRDPTAKDFGVSQNDWHGFCECPACKAVDDEEESHAGTMVRFVNAVAEAVEKEFPDKVVETLAYQYTRKPPKKTRLRRNVMPCLCTIECDFARPIATSPYEQNVKFVKDIEGWAAQTDQLYIWDYTVNFRHYPHAFPNVDVLQDNIRFFRDNKVKSLFEQGGYQGRHAWMAELKTWLIAKWMWNPELPADDLIDRFFAGYFGKAAPYARRIFEETQAAQREWMGSDPKRALKIFEDVGSPALTAEMLSRHAALWREAAAAVKGEAPSYGYNVRMGAFSTDYSRFLRGTRAYWVTRHPERFDGVADSVGLARSLLAAMNEAKDIRIAEGRGRTENFRARLESVVESGTARAASDSARAYAIAFHPGHGKLVADAKAEKGKSIELSFKHYEWSAQFPMRSVAYDPGVDYLVRVRLRADVRKDAPPASEVFWAGVYDPVQKRGLGKGLSLKAKDVKDGWAWYDVCTFKPTDDCYVWIGPGRFDKGKNTESPSHRGVWVDAVEIVRK